MADEQSGRVTRGMAWGLVAAVVIGGTYVLAGTWYGGDLETTVNWPDNWSWSADSAIRVAVTDAEGHPRPKTRVQLGLVPNDRDEPESTAAGVLSGEWNVLASGATDENGRVWLELPAAREQFEKADDLPESPTVAVRAAEGWSSAIEAYAFDAPPRARLAMAADRSSYRPGQLVRLRGTLFEPDGSGPIASPEGEKPPEATLSVAAPGGEVVFRDRVVPSRSGLVTTEVELADEAPPGSYRATLSYAGAEATRHLPVRPDESAVVDVALEVDRVHDGGPILQGTVSAEYAYGEPLQGGELEVVATAIGASSESTGASISDSATLGPDGTHEFALEAPPVRSPRSGGDAWRVEARVVDAEGRRATTSTAVQPAGEVDRVEVLPAGNPRFRAGEVNDAIVLVRDADGNPLSEVDVTWIGTDSEDDQEEGGGVTAEEAMTDERGVARFEWRPGGSFEQARGVEATVRVAGEEQPTQRFVTPVSVVPSGSVLLAPSTAVPTAGSSVEFDLDLPDSGGFGSGELPVVAVHDREVVGRNRVGLEPAGRPASGSIELDERVRGLTYLVVLSERGRRLGETPIWVRQPGGSELEMGFGEREDGGEARRSVSVRMPAGAGEDDEEREAAVFGMRAVDAADVGRNDLTGGGFPAALWHDRGSVDAASRAASVPGVRAGSSREADDSLLASRVARAVADDDSGFAASARGLDLNRAAASWSRHGWYQAWSVFLYLVLVVLVVAAIRLTRRYHLAGSFGWRALGSFAAAVAGGVGLHAAIHWGTHFFGVLEPAHWLVPGAAVICLLLGLVQAHFRAPDAGFRRWAGLVVAQYLLLLFVLWTGEAAGATPLEIPGFGVVVLGWMACLVGTGIFWATRLLNTRLNWAFLGVVAAVAGALVAPTLVLSADETAGRAGVGWLFPDRAEAREAGEGGERVPDRSDDPAKRREVTPDLGSERNSPSSRPLVWRPEIADEGEGRAAVEFEAPEPGEDWQIEAVAHTPNGRVAHGTMAVRAEHPIRLETELPRRLRSGDRPEIPVVVSDERESGGDPLEVRLRASSDGTLRLRKRRKTVRLPAGGRRVVNFPVVADGVGKGTIGIQGSVGGTPVRTADEIADAVEAETEAVAAGRTILRSESGWISDGWSTAFQVPLAAYPRSLSARLEVFAGPVPLAFDAADSITARPHDSFEQIVSAIAPSILALRRLQKVGRGEWPGGESRWAQAVRRAERQVSRGYQQLLRCQRREGGFAAYPGAGREPAVAPTAYGLLHLAAVDRAVDGIDAGRPVERASRWLVSARDDDGAWGGERGGRDELTALALWALARSPVDDKLVDGAVERGIGYLEDRRRQDEDLSSTARAIAANAIAEIGDLEDASAMLEGLIKRREPERAAAYWVPSSKTMGNEVGSNGAVVRTSLVARAVAASKEASEMSRAAVRFLADRRHPRGGWGTPRASAWAAEALADADIWQTDKPNLLEVTLDGNPMRGPEGNGAARVFPGRSSRKRFEADEFFPGTRRFAVYPKIGEVSAIAQATIEYAVPWNSRAPGVERVPVELDLEVSSRDVEGNEPVELTVTAENGSEEPVGGGLVYLPLPPGGWVDAERLRAKSSERAGRHLERTSTHLVAHVSALDPGENWTFRYTIRPRLSGRYRLPPVRAEVYDDPRQPAVSEGGSLRVEGDAAE